VNGKGNEKVRGRILTVTASFAEYEDRERASKNEKKKEINLSLVKPPEVY